MSERAGLSSMRGSSRGHRRGDDRGIISRGRGGAMSRMLDESERSTSGDLERRKVQSPTHDRGRAGAGATRGSPVPAAPHRPARGVEYELGPAPPALDWERQHRGLPATRGGRGRRQPLAGARRHRLGRDLTRHADAHDDGAPSRRRLLRRPAARRPPLGGVGLGRGVHGRQRRRAAPGPLPPRHPRRTAHPRSRAHPRRAAALWPRRRHPRARGGSASRIRATASSRRRSVPRKASSAPLQHLARRKRQAPAAGLQRSLQRQVEEEEPVQGLFLQRQAEQEGEEAEVQELALQRQEEQEEEKEGSE